MRPAKKFTVHRNPNTGSWLVMVSFNGNRKSVEACPSRIKARDVALILNKAWEEVENSLGQASN